MLEVFVPQKPSGTGGKQLFQIVTHCIPPPNPEIQTVFVGNTE